MILLHLALSVQLAFASTEPELQPRIDQAFELIFQSQLGQSVCRDILGADAAAIEMHLGVSRKQAEKLAGTCSNAQPSLWVAATDPADIRKLATSERAPRTYRMAPQVQEGLIESWTDPNTNVTVIYGEAATFSTARWVQVLAHEMAVYFDAKATPARPDAQQLPHFRTLSLQSPSSVNPFVAAGNPVIAHSLTYLRALQVEVAILNELIQKNLVEKPADFDRADLQYLASPQCAHACIESFILRMRTRLLPIALPLLARASDYRAATLRELLRLQPDWTPSQWLRARNTLEAYPVRFLNRRDPKGIGFNIQDDFLPVEEESLQFATATNFLRNDLWPLEWPAISQSRFAKETFLEFTKQPLLSGYNVLMSSGPRVRLVIGLIE